jgi:hypothetical protein
MKETKLKVGPYSRAATSDNAYNIVDEYGMMTTTNPPNYGRGDSHESNWLTYLIYNDWGVVAMSASLWYETETAGGKYVGQRHPLISVMDHPISRDHYVYTLLQLRLYEKRNNFAPGGPKINRITSQTGWIISKMARKTLSLIFWSNAIQGDKMSEFLYYVTEILTLLLWYLPSHALGSLIANYGKEVDQDEWKKIQLQDQPKYKTVISKIIYPSYALTFEGFKLYVLDGLPLMKRLVKWLHRPMIGKTNYVQKMLFGMKVPRDKVEDFVAMQGGRWSGYLNSRNDRNLKALDPQPIYNKLDVDLARFLFNETQL